MGDRRRGYRIRSVSGGNLRVFLPGLLLLVLLLAAACGLDLFPDNSNGDTPASNTPGSGSGAAVQVDKFWVEPGDGVGPVLSEMRSARTSLDVVVYLLTNKEVVAEIVAAHRRGVRVRVMVEEDPFGGGSGNGAALKQLDAGGVEWKFGNPTYRYTHEKAIITDRRRALVMTANLTKSAFTRNREYIALLTSTPEVDEIQALFDADWNRTRRVPRVPSLVVSDTNSREKLLGLIGSAGQTLEIHAEVMADREIRGALVAAHRRGVRVRVIMSAPEPGESSYEGLSELARAGVEVRTLESPYIHAKAVLADGGRAYIGSINFTATSMDQNRELGLLTETADVLRELRQAFKEDWEKGETFSPGGSNR